MAFDRAISYYTDSWSMRNEAFKQRSAVHYGSSVIHIHQVSRQFLWSLAVERAKVTIMFFGCTSVHLYVHPDSCLDDIRIANNCRREAATVCPAQAWNGSAQRQPRTQLKLDQPIRAIQPAGLTRRPPTGWMRQTSNRSTSDVRDSIIA